MDGPQRFDDPKNRSWDLRARHSADLEILSSLQPEIAQWWMDRFGQFLPQTGGLLTPPQRQAIPRINRGQNTLISAPTGAGKCVLPDTPILVRNPDGSAAFVSAGAATQAIDRPVALVDDNGFLFSSDLEVFSLDVGSNEIRPKSAGIYVEPYDGPVYRITTRSDAHVTVTPDHPVLALTDDGPTWRPAKLLASGVPIGAPTRAVLANLRTPTKSNLQLRQQRRSPRDAADHDDGVLQRMWAGPSTHRVCESGADTAGRDESQRFVAHGSVRAQGPNENRTEGTSGAHTPHDASIPRPASKPLVARPDDRSAVIRWTPIRTVERRHYAGPIIDLTVPGTANFIGGSGGLFLHNTLAAFTGIINKLLEQSNEDSLDNSVYCLYISPLKSLANDIHRNLAIPLEEIARRRGNGGEPTIRHAIRHGDTDATTKSGMLEETPHILNTTPETLAILLNSPKFREKLRSIEFVIVDEIHSVADNKRGTHLSVSLERLETLLDTSPTRIGCSATVEPLDSVSKFLVGRPSVGAPPRNCEIVDTRFVRSYDLALECPTADLLGTPKWEVQDRLYERLNELIQAHQNTIVFTNTRSGAERVLYNLRDRFDGYDEATAACHHGSLAEEQRKRVESGLKAGQFDVVTTSTSLELGIDMPSVDLVIQIGSPKSVASFLQRVGRAGHRIGQTVKGRVIALDIDDLIECTAMIRAAEEGFIDALNIPENAHDVAAQHVYGMAINAIHRESTVKSTLKRAYPYWSYSDADWESLLRYLTVDYEEFANRNVYPKIWCDTNDPPGGDQHHPDFPPGVSLIGRRGRLARPIYLTNVGTIPDSFTCQVFTRTDDEWVGDLDEEYLDTLEQGDVFVLGGNRFEFRYRRGSKVYVDRTDARPTVPSWYSERMPLSTDLGRKIQSLQESVVTKYREGGAATVRDWLRSFPIDENAVRALSRVYTDQIELAGPKSINTAAIIAIEEIRDHDRYKRRYYVHSTLGRRVNDGLSRLLGHACATATDRPVTAAVSDHGFVLTIPLNQHIDLPSILQELDPDEVRDTLRSAVAGTDLLQRYFRINATRSLMILKRYKGYEKSASEQQVSSEMYLGLAEDLEDFIVLEETYREILEDKLAVGEVRDIVEAIGRGRVTISHLTLESPSPRATGLATLTSPDVVLTADTE